MEIVRSTATLAFQADLLKDTSVTQPPQSVQIFIKGELCRLSVGNQAHRQEIKEMLGQSVARPVDNGRPPHFSAATGEQKASVKALLASDFII